MQKLAPKAQSETVPPRGRGRPRTFDRTQALGGAMRLFWRKGYSGTAISDLTEVMGIGTKSLYAAFGSKQALYAETVRHYLECYEERVWGRFDAAPTAREAVEYLLMDSADVLTRAPSESEPLGCMVTLSTAGFDGTPELGELVSSLRTQLYQRLRARLARAIEERELSSSLDLDAVCRFFFILQNGLSVQARAGCHRIELEKSVQIAMRSWSSFVDA